MGKTAESLVKKLRNICNKCPKKNSCIKPCNEIEKYLANLNENISEEIEIKQQHYLPRLPLDYQSAPHKELPSFSDENLEGAKKKLTAVLNQVFPGKKNANIKKTFKMYIECSTMPYISKIENCSKQYIFKKLVMVIKKISEILDKEEIFQGEKLRTPLQFKKTFGLC